MNVVSSQVSENVGHPPSPCQEKEGQSRAHSPHCSSIAPLPPDGKGVGQRRATRKNPSRPYHVRKILAIVTNDSKDSKATVKVAWEGYSGSINKKTGKHRRHRPSRLRLSFFEENPRTLVMSDAFKKFYDDGNGPRYRQCSSMTQKKIAKLVEASNKIHDEEMCCVFMEELKISIM